MALKTMLEKIKAAETAKTEACVNAREDITKGLAEALPEGYDLVWWQYANYFNDGDPCVFEVRGARLVSAGDLLPSSPWTDGGFQFGYRREYLEGIPAAQLDAVADLFFAIPDDVLEDTFGTDAVVRINRAGVLTTGDYSSHD